MFALIVLMGTTDHSENILTHFPHHEILIICFRIKLDQLKWLLFDHLGLCSGQFHRLKLFSLPYISLSYTLLFNILKFSPLKKFPMKNNLFLNKVIFLFLKNEAFFFFLTYGCLGDWACDFRASGMQVLYITIVLSPPPKSRSLVGSFI